VPKGKPNSLPASLRERRFLKGGRARGVSRKGEAMDREDRRSRGNLAALPAWAVGKFTEHQAAVIGAVGVEMLNKRGVCALHLKVIAVAAGVNVGTAREAIMIAETIGLVTVEHLRGFYDIRCRSPDWLPALRELRGV